MHDYDLIVAPLIALLCVAIGFVVYLNDRKDASGKVVAIMSSTIGGWIIFAFLSDIVKDPLISLLLNRLIFVSLILFMSSMLYLPFIFPYRSKSANVIKMPLIIFSFLFSAVTLISPFIISSIRFENWGSNIIYGKYFIVFIIYTVISILLLIIKFVINYIKLKSLDRSKIKLFFFGLIVVTLINIFVQVILRNIVGSDEYYRFGNYSVIIFVAFTAYAIIRQRLFNVKVILTEIGVAIVIIAVLEQIFLSKSILYALVNIFLFLLVAYGGYILIKSVQDEIRRRIEVTKLGAKLEEANIKLQEMDRTKSEFLSVASHELNSPMAVIKGYLHMILKEGFGKVDKTARTYLEHVYNKTDQLAKLVSDLLNVSRIEQGRVKVEIQSCAVMPIIESAVENYNVKAREKNIAINLKKPTAALPKVSADPGKLEEIFSNLLSNSVKYTKAGHVDISVEKADGQLKFTISDTGVGIPKEAQKNIFQKFYRVDNSWVREAGGTGLGLYIIKGYIELMRGKIWFESAGEDKGSAFYFTLPIAKAGDEGKIEEKNLEFEQKNRPDYTKSNPEEIKENVDKIQNNHNGEHPEEKAAEKAEPAAADKKSDQGKSLKEQLTANVAQRKVMKEKILKEAQEYRKKHKVEKNIK